MILDIKKNKSICPYPFMHSYVGSKYERKLCCVSDDVKGYDKSSLSDFWNSSYMKEVRKKMINGEPIKECNRCYYFESVNVSSLREQCTRDYDDDLFKDYNFETGEMNKNPIYFDHRTIHCNLQCLSCGSTYSSTHMNLVEKMWNFRLDFTIDTEYEKQAGEEIKQSILRKECTAIYWAGGEPMMSTTHWDVVELMDNLSRDPEYSQYIAAIKVHYNTNLTRSTWKNKSIPDMLEFYQPRIQASIDGTHETFEYCRDGASWDTVSKNWDLYFSKLNKNEQFGIASVLSSPVIMDIDRWFDFFEPYNVSIYNHKYICYAENYPDSAQSFLDIRMFPDSVINRVINHAIERFENTKMVGASNSIEILKSYVLEKNDNPEFFSNTDMLRELKSRSEYRDKFLVGKLTYPMLLQKLDKEAYDWYMSL